MCTHRRTVGLLLAIIALAAEKKAERVDCHGDPLPRGVIARLGTVRGRLPGLATACAFSRDGKVLAAAGGDANIHLFDAATLRPLRQLHRHKERVTCLAFSPDGKALVSGSEDGTLCFWEWPSGKVLRHFPAHTKGVRVLAFAGTGKFLASGGEDKLVRLWDAATGRALRQYKGHKEAVRALAVSPDGRLVVSSDRPSDPVQLWDAASGRLLHQHKTGVHFVESLAFSPDNKLVALPMDFLQVGLWDVASGKIARRLKARLSGRVSAVAFSPDGRNVAAAAVNHSFVLWDAATGKMLHQRPGNFYVRHPGGITCLAFSPNGRRLAFGEDHCLRVWDIGAWREVHPVEGHSNPIYRVQFSRDNKTAVTVADDVADALQEWDAATGKKLRTLWQKHLPCGYTFHLSPDHRILTITDTEEKNLLLCSYDTTTGKEVRRVKMPFNREGGYNPATIVLSPDGKIITSEARDEGALFARGLLVRDAATGKTLGEVSSHEEWFQDRFLFAPDSHTLACVRKDQVDLFNVPKRRIVRKLPFSGENYYARSTGFSRDSRLVAVATAKTDDWSAGPIVVWEATTGQKLAALWPFRSPVSALAFSADGALLVGGDTKGTLFLWSMAAGKEIGQLQGHHGRIESLTFSNDGKQLASGSADTTALIWDIREVAEAARPRPIDVSRQRLEHLWADLCGNDSARAHRAIWELTAARQALPWLREYLKPVLPADAREMARLIADLDSDEFTVREKATKDVEALGEAAGPALRKALASKPSLEMRRRIEPIVEKLDNWPALSTAALREWRALEVLEHIGTPEARKLLERLSEGVAEAGLTREAKAALRRTNP